MFMFYFVLETHAITRTEAKIIIFLGVTRANLDIEESTILSRHGQRGVDGPVQAWSTRSRRSCLGMDNEELTAVSRHGQRGVDDLLNDYVQASTPRSQRPSLGREQLQTESDHRGSRID